MFVYSTISFLYGIEGWAPGRVTDMADALAANVQASLIPRPSERATQSAPLKVSPAAVVSTAFTGFAGTMPRKS